jgi:hypothetical protein
MPVNYNPGVVNRSGELFAQGALRGVESFTQGITGGMRERREREAMANRQKADQAFQKARMNEKFAFEQGMAQTKASEEAAEKAKNDASLHKSLVNVAKLKYKLDPNLAETMSGQELETWIGGQAEAQKFEAAQEAQKAAQAKQEAWLQDRQRVDRYNQILRGGLANMPGGGGSRGAQPGVGMAGMPGGGSFADVPGVGLGSPKPPNRDFLDGPSWQPGQRAPVDQRMSGGMADFMMPGQPGLQGEVIGGPPGPGQQAGMAPPPPRPAARPGMIPKSASGSPIDPRALNLFAQSQAGLATPASTASFMPSPPAAPLTPMQDQYERNKIRAQDDKHNADKAALKNREDLAPHELAKVRLSVKAAQASLAKVDEGPLWTKDDLHKSFPVDGLEGYRIVPISSNSAQLVNTADKSKEPAPPEVVRLLEYRDRFIKAGDTKNAKIMSAAITSKISGTKMRPMERAILRQIDPDGYAQMVEDEKFFEDEDAKADPAPSIAPKAVGKGGKPWDSQNLFR